MKQFNSFLAALIFVCILGFALGYLAATIRYNPNCPTEDSCYADYENGRWTIIEGERPVEQYLLPND